MSIYTAAGNLVEPGDFAAVHSHGQVSAAIDFGEKLCGDRFRQYEHAIFYAGPENDLDLILEAEPAGAQLVPFHYQPTDVVWSSDNPKLALTKEQRQLAMVLARRYKGTPYAFADYLAIAEHRVAHVPGWVPFGLDSIPGKGLRPVTLAGYMKANWHDICSQLVDQLRLDMGSHLFADGRLAGDVIPLDLADLILAA